MILRFADTETPYNGRVEGSIYISSGLRGIGRIRNRPANSRQRQQWRPPWSLAAGKAAFAALSTNVQESWNEWAEENFCWPIQGSPRFTTGEIYFANAYTVLEIFSGATPSPTVPVEGPDWQDKPKFFEFAAWESGTYTIKAETDFAEGTELIFSGLPPSKTVFNGEWFGEKIIGSDSLEFGLYENEEYSGVHAMMETAFQTISTTDKIWNRIWEKYPESGFIRTLKDPCVPDPTDAPPAVGLTVCIYNARDVAVEYLIIDLTDENFEIIGSAEFGFIAAESEECIEDVLHEGYTTDDISELLLVGEWQDFEPIDALEFYDGSNPWEYTVDSFF